MNCHNAVVDIAQIVMDGTPNVTLLVGELDVVRMPASLMDPDGDGEAGLGTGNEFLISVEAPVESIPEAGVVRVFATGNSGTTVLEFDLSGE